MNYQPVRLENQANKHAGLQEANQNASTEDYIDAGDSPIEAESAQDYFVLPIWSSYTSTVKNSKAGEEPTKHHDFKQVDKEDQVFLDELERLKRKEQDANDAAEALKKEFAQETEDLLLQVGAAKASSTNIVNTASTPVSTASPYVADFTNLEPVVDVSPIPTSRIKSIHPSTLILGDLQSAVQTRSKVTKSSGAYAFILIDLPDGKKAIGTKWVYINKKDERGVVVRNKARLVAQGHRQEEGINYDEVFAPMARIEAIMIFLAFASYMGFIVYQMDVKSAFVGSRLTLHFIYIIHKSELEKRRELSCLLKEQLLEPALNLTVHCCGLEFRVLNGYDQKSFDEERGLNCVVQTGTRITLEYSKTIYHDLHCRKLQFDAKEPVGFDKTKVECYSCHKTGHFARECRSKGNQDGRRRDTWNTGNKEKDNGRRSGKQEDSKALVTLDGEGVDWTSHSEDEQENYAFMACNSSGSDTKVTSCSKECKESYVKLKKLYDEQREQLGDASIEIQAYTQALKKVEAQLVAHQQGQLWYEEKIRFMKIDLDDKTDVLTYHKKLLAEAEKEKEDLKAKISARDKVRFGYGDQLNKGVLSYENEVFQSVFVSRTSETENSPVNDRYAKGMHVVPPPMTGIYIPSGPDKEIDDSQFSYGPKQSKPSESDARSSNFNSCESNCSEETHESMPEPVINEPKVVSETKVWSDAPIIEEYESDSEDEHVSLPTKQQEIHSFADKHVKTPKQTVIEQNACNQSSKLDKKDCSGLMSKKWGWDLSIPKRHVLPKAGFHKSVSPFRKSFNSTTALRTKTSKIPVSIARASGTNNVSTTRHNFKSQAVQTNAARKISTVKPFVNRVRPKTVLHKTHSPFRRPFNNTTTLRTNFTKQKVNTVEVNAISAVEGKRETAVKPSSGCNWRPKRHYWHKISKYNGGSRPRDCATFKDPLGRLKPKQVGNKGIVDSGCSKHMTGNKAYLAEYQDFNGVPVAFRGSKGYITGKGKFNGKSDEGFLVGYSLQSKAFRVYNLETKRVEENLHITFLENKPNVAGKGPTWLFDLDYLTNSMNYQPVRSENQANKHAGPQEANQNAGTEENIDAGDSPIEAESAQDYFVLPIWSSYTLTVKSSKAGEEPLRADDRVRLSPIYFLPTLSITPIYVPLRYLENGGVIQMDVKSAFLYGKINEKVYVSQPPSFIDPKYPKKVYKVVKALYGLHQAPRAWYATLSTFLLKNGYRRETIEKTLFIKKDKHDIILVQVYVDDIIFGSTKKSWCDKFDALMQSRFQMKILKKFDFVSVKTASTPIKTQKPLVKDDYASDVDVHLYRSMIGSLMYLTASRPDIMFAVYACSGF
ncbi:ribonuclease H-like domain-containing protein [Tanacetum coccineum]